MTLPKSTIQIAQLIWWQKQLSDLRDAFASRNLDRSALVDLCDSLDQSVEPADVGSSVRKLLDSNCRLLLSQILNNTEHYKRLTDILEQLRLHSRSTQGNTAALWTQFLIYATFLKSRTTVHEEVAALDHMDQLVIVAAIIKLTNLLLQLLSSAPVASKSETPRFHSTGGFTLWVGNIPLHFDRADLASLLSTGPISISPKQIAVKRGRSKETGADYKYAFCNFDTLAEAVAAKSQIQAQHPDLKVHLKSTQ